MTDGRAYVIKFHGHYPVGACAVVFAKGPEQALHLLKIELGKVGLNDHRNTDLGMQHVQELDPSVLGAHIILDGNY